MISQRTILQNGIGTTDKVPFTLGFASLCETIPNEVEFLDYNPRIQVNNFSLQANNNEIRKTSTILCPNGNEKMWDYDVPDRS